MKYAWIREHERQFPVQRMCTLLTVSRPGFYAWRRREPSDRAKADEALAQRVKVIFDESHQTYGAVRIVRSLRQENQRVGRERVRRLMREQSLRATARKRFCVTTDSNHRMPVADNLLNQTFVAERPHQVWLADITYVPTAEGWLYLACVLDLYSRRIVGWSTGAHMDADLPLWALSMAAWRFEPRGTICHSDRGSQYASALYQQFLARHDLVCSMSRKGNCYDNAPMESFFHTLKVECLHRHRFTTRDEAKTVIARYIESFYNNRRLHSSIGYRTPQQAMQHAHAVVH